MTESKIIKINNCEWCVCGKCNHKLARVVSVGDRNHPPIFEIKCHSCKEINLVDIKHNYFYDWTI